MCIISELGFGFTTHFFLSSTYHYIHVYDELPCTCNSNFYGMYPRTHTLTRVLKVTGTFRSMPIHADHPPYRRFAFFRSVYVRTAGSAPPLCDLSICFVRRLLPSFQVYLEVRGATAMAFVFIRGSGDKQISV